MKKLTNTEANVLAVALDHMEEHILDVQMTCHPDIDLTQDRLDAVKTLRTKLYDL